MSDQGPQSAIHAWLRCPYCGAGGDRIDLSVGGEHVTVSCSFCESVLSENHHEGQQTGHYAEGVSLGEPE